ncbi:MAG: cytochrome c biogenesis protein CcsA [Flavihumibacter sp.]
MLQLLALAVVGLVGGVPAKPIINESIRNLYFHVSMWFAMMILFTAALVNTVKYLRTGNLKYDTYAVEYTNSGIIFCILGLVTGMIWANYTWGKPWSNDPKQTGAAIALLIYLAYLVLRGSLTDIDKKARISAVYGVFAFFMLIPTLWVIPRLLESLHPGGMGNPAFNTKDADVRMRIIFWPLAVPGWTLLGVWITTLRIRLRILEEKKLQHA